MLTHICLRTVAALGLGDDRSYVAKWTETMVQFTLSTFLNCL